MNRIKELEAENAVLRHQLKEAQDQAAAAVEDARKTAKCLRDYVFNSIGSRGIAK